MNQNVSGQQFKNNSFLSFKVHDSVVVSKIYYHDKEFSAPLATTLIPAKK